jgi:hypothetical protein
VKNQPSASSWETSAQCAGYSLVHHCRIWHCGPVLFWGGGNNGYRSFRLLHWNVRELFAAPTGRNGCGGCLVSAGWSNGSYSVEIHASFAGNVSGGKLISPARRCRVASAFRLISLPAISSCGGISNQRCTHTNLKTFKPSRTLFASKSPLFPLQWPNESCEHSEIVSRSVSLMMATILVISFLKYDDKNYFIYPLLCYKEMLCIFYRFCRINIWNVVLLFGSPCFFTIHHIS